MYDYEDLEEYDDGYDIDCYMEIGFEYIVNCGCKVGSWFDRFVYNFPLDEEDKLEKKIFTDALQAPLREGLFDDCVITDIFSMIKVES